MKKLLVAITVIALSSAVALVGRVNADKNDHGFQLYPDNLLVSRSVYDNNPNNVPANTILPPLCNVTLLGLVSAGGGCNNTFAPFNGSYPEVWNNDAYDASFGITSKIFIDQMTPRGWVLGSLEVPSDPKHDYMVTSFSSKSEIALNLSTDKKYVTFMGYLAPIGTLDVSNANTSDAFDATNPVGTSAPRVVGEIDENGKLEFTLTNAYSGNNGRAAIYYHSKTANVYLTAGNAGNGGNPEPIGVLQGAGAQIMSPAEMPESKQTPGTPTSVASFNVDELVGGSAAGDKLGKDDNFRGETIFNNVLYFTKGSGSNGVNTVYFVDTNGGGCKTDGTTTGSGIGLPVAGATLPTTAQVAPSTLLTTGFPDNMCILSGFPSMPNKLLKKTVNPAFPFGVWFADANTVYVADEGDGNIGKNASCPASPAVCDPFLDAKSQTTAGLQKWTFNGTTWTYQYTLQAGLELGVPYTIPGYPTGNNAGTANKVFTTGLPWTPATDGLRNITGRVNWDGAATIWAITSTVSGNGDQGADPNRLVAITDNLGATGPTAPANESFQTLRTAGFAEVLRGVSFTPGTGVAEGDGDHDGDDQGHGRNDR
jgi:hypothetical protein